MLKQNKITRFNPLNNNIMAKTKEVPTDPKKPTQKIASTKSTVKSGKKA